MMEISNKLYWLKKWKEMMCDKMLSNDAECCISDVLKYPCKMCMYYSWE